MSNHAKANTQQALPLTMATLIEQCAAKFGDRIAVQESGAKISYQEIDELRQSAAKAFIAAGLEKGDRISLWAPNFWEWIVIAIGAQTVGGVVVTVNNRLSGEEAADIIGRSGSKMLFTVGQLEQGAPKQMLNGQSLPNLADIIELRTENNAEWHSFIQRGESVSDQQLAEIAKAVLPSDPMDMLFTSGTTGKPKGVVCSHQQNIKVSDSWAGTVGLRGDDRYLIVSPFFHSFGYKAGWLAAFTRGCTVFPMLAFDAEQAMEVVERERITTLPGAPSLYEMLLAHPKRSQYDLSSLRLGVTGAATIPVKLVEDMWSVLGFDTVVTGYGLTESSGVVSLCHPGDSAERIAQTSGRAVEGVEIKCVDPATQLEVPRGQEGELWVRGYNIMLEYFEMPEATAETITADGWLRTGDIAVMDDDGYIRITDRLKDMYIMNGENVYPAEVEKLLFALDGVAQVAVIGVPKSPQGEVGMAFIVLKPGAELSKEQVVAFCAESLARYKVPFYVEFVSSLPMNASGKVTKPALKTQARQLLSKG